MAANFPVSKTSVSGLSIVYWPPQELNPRPRNPRTHTPKQLRQIAESIKAFGFINPVLIDGDGGIVAGHGRVEAAKSLGMADIPTVRVDHLSPAQIRAYVIADNRIAENAGWDRTLLALELQDLTVELDFDVTVTGFETAEVDILISDLNGQAVDQADDVPDVDRAVPAVSRPGDRWLLGDHVLLCGDALTIDSYNQLLGAKKAQLVFMDPPYNVPIQGNVSGLGRARHQEFVMASGEMTRDQFAVFLSTVFERLVAFSTDGSIHFVCMDWRHIREVLDAADHSYDDFKNLCVWTKSNAGMGSLYRSQHELVFVFKKGTASHINNVELGRFGRNRSNVWHYPGVNSFGKERDADLAMHPTVKPVAMVVDAILDCSRRGGIVLDAFAGSGTTLIAAERTGRRGFGLEIDPYYVDTAIRRFEQAFEITAVHAGSGLDFSNVRAQRTDPLEEVHGEAN